MRGDARAKMGFLGEARRLLDFTVAVEPSLERSVALLQLVLELDDSTAGAVPFVARLSRTHPNDRLLLGSRSDVIERRRRFAAESERQGHLADASRTLWDVLPLDPGDVEATAHRERVRQLLKEG